jgi:acetoin utilization protein AcuB
MNIGQLITFTFPVLSPDDTGDRALDLMHKNNFTELPVVADDEYVGLLRENELLEWDDTQNALGSSGLLHYKPAISASAHPFEAMRIMHQMALSVLPVIDNDHKYFGSITKDALLTYITEKSGIDAPGGIIVLEVAPRNYTLYEIARICENEDVIIMNLQVCPNDAGMLDITLKLNRTTLEAVVSSFERHSYHVKASYGDENQSEDITDKYNLLMNYIYM